MIVARTPHRISLFGGGTDFPAWYRRYGGAVIGGAIDKYCYLTVRELPPFFEHKYRVVYSQIETVSEAQSIRHPAVRQAVLDSGIRVGLEIHHDADLPARTGIGSSSAFAVGILQALSALCGQRPSPQELASRAILLEREQLGEVGGHQDQVFCAHGGFRRIEFSTDGEIVVGQPLAIAAKLQEWLVLVYTGVKRNSSTISEAFADRLDAHQNDRDLGELADVTNQAVSLLSSNDALHMEELGRLMDHSWMLKERMNPLAVPEHMRDLYRQAKAAGASGGKISGAGGGGFCLFIVEPSRQPDFARRMDPCLIVPFSFVAQGSEIIFDGQPVEGPHREKGWLERDR